MGLTLRNQFPLVAATAYWLPSLLDEEDIDFTLGNISQAGFNAVRVWAFNDVDTIPENGTWFQHIDRNGTVTINDGTNGLQKLDIVVRLAEKHGILLILSLTNNWNPFPPSSGNDPTNIQRNVLSNQYGGMDVYVRQLAERQEHDQFYVDQSLIGVYKNYITRVVSRYKDSPYVLSWEIANDPRCDSSVSPSDNCTSFIITKWHAEIAQHISRVDPNHLISSGYTRVVDVWESGTNLAAVSQGSSAQTAENSTGIPRLQLNRHLPLAEDSGSWLESRRKAMGRLQATTKRQPKDVGNGPAFSGPTGVDSEDILNIPEIGFGSFHLFPDQFTYGLVESSSPLTPSETLAVGLDWIERQSQVSVRAGKPVVLTGYGLVTQNSSQFFVPFNSIQAPYGTATVYTARNQQQPRYGVTDQQAGQIFTEWIKTAFNGNIAGVSYHQWRQEGLKTGPGIPVQSNDQAFGRRALKLHIPGISPNDGYSGRCILNVVGIHLCK